MSDQNKAGEDLVIDGIGVLSELEKRPDDTQQRAGRLEEQVQALNAAALKGADALRLVKDERNRLNDELRQARKELSRVKVARDKALREASERELGLRATAQVLRIRNAAHEAFEGSRTIVLSRKLVAKQREWRLKSKLSAEALRDIERLEKSGLFDEAYYQYQYPEVLKSGVDPVTDFYTNGLQLRRNPNPLFDTKYYVQQCPELAQQNANPLLHYLDGGYRKFNPSTIFDTAYYLQQVDGADVVPLAHYFERGASSGLNPTLMFDSSFYLRRNADVKDSEINPLVHYLLAGRFEGRQPHPLFDPSFYLSGMKASLISKFSLKSEDDIPVLEKFYAHSYLLTLTQKENSLTDPLAHYLSRSWDANKDPHPLFVSSFYLHNYPDVTKAKANPLLHYLKNGWKELRKTHPLFDPYFYVAQLPQLVEGKSDPLSHFLQCDSDFANPHEYFDATYYLKMNPDVAASGQNPLAHYVVSGEKENRMPNPHFDPLFYSIAYPKVVEAGMSPLAHYAARGIAEMRARNRVEFEAQEKRKHAAAKPTEIALRFERTANPKVSVIIPVYGQLNFTEQCLRSLAKHSSKYSFEVIVVDDCSPDNSYSVLSAIPGLTVIRAEQNGGFIMSCNLGAEHARGEFLLFLNNDTEVCDAWLDELIGTFEIFPQAGLVGSKLVYPNGRLQEAGGIIYRDGSAANFGRNDDASKPEYNYLRSVDYCSGASIAIPKTLFEKVGRFNELYKPAYVEDVELAFAVRKAGYQVFYQPLSSIVHYEGVSSGTDLNSGVKAYQVSNLAKFKERWADEITSHPIHGPEPYIERNRDVACRLLVVDSFTPKPDHDAGSALTFEWIENFRKWGYDCTYYPVHNFRHAGIYSDNLQRIGVKCIYPPQPKVLERFLEQQGDVYDVILIFRSTVFSEEIDGIKKNCPSAKIIFHTIDLHHLRHQREFELDGTEESRLLAQKFKIDEFRAIEMSDCTVLVSAVEKEILEKELDSPRLSVIPLSSVITSSCKPFRDRRDLLFIGGFQHPPNVDAVIYFTNEVLPIVRKSIPSVRFFILGGHAPPEVRDLANIDVIVTGQVEDLSRYFGACRLSVAPLRVGAGMKGKVLTSLGFGLPCVATSIAGEGIGLTDRETILLANSTEELAARVVEVYSDEKLWSKLSGNGMTFIDQNYSPQRVRNGIADILGNFGLPNGTTRVSQSRVPAASPSR